MLENWTGRSLTFHDGYVWLPDGNVEVHVERTDVLEGFRGLSIFDGFPIALLPVERRGVMLVVNENIPYARDDLVYPCYSDGKVVGFQKYESKYVGVQQYG